MLLKNLINNLKPELAAHKIRGISFDSRVIKKGDLFISILGNKFDGDKYIKHAVSKGATAVIHSRPLKKIKKIFYIKVKDARDTLAKISVKFFKKKPKNIVAVTGTNGKTSISDFFHQIFTLQNKKVGFLGTLGSKKNKKLETRNLTTLDSVRLSKDLRGFPLINLTNFFIILDL